MGAVALPVADAHARRSGRRLSPRSWFGDATPESVVLRVGIVIVGLFMALTALDVGGLAGLWESAHWTAAGCLAALYAALVAMKATGPDRRIAGLVAVGTLAWLIGQFAWMAQTAIGYFNVPAPSDLCFLMVAPPIVAAFIIAVNGRLPRVEKVAVYLDAVAIFLTLTAIILAIYGGQVGVGATSALVAIAYPVVHLAAAAAGLVALLAAPGLAARWRLRPAGRTRGPGFAWIGWLRQAVEALPPAGSVGNYAFSVGMILVGFGARDWRLGEGHSTRFRQVVSRGPRRPAVGGAAGERDPPDAVEPGDERARSHQGLLAGGHPPRRSAPVPARPRARPPARRLARLTDRPGDRAAPARRGGHALPDPRRARPGGGLHRRRRPGRDRRRPPRLHEPPDRGHPRLPARGLPRDPNSGHGSPIPTTCPRRSPRSPNTGGRKATPARLPDDRRGRLRSSGSTTRPTRCATRRPVAGGSRRASWSTRPSRSASRRNSSTTRSTIR